MQINNSTSQSNFGMALGPRLKEYSQVARTTLKNKKLFDELLQEIDNRTKGKLVYKYYSDLDNPHSAEIVAIKTDNAINRFLDKILDEDIFTIRGKTIGILGSYGAPNSKHPTLFHEIGTILGIDKRLTQPKCEIKKFR